MEEIGPNFRLSTGLEAMCYFGASSALTTDDAVVPEQRRAGESVCIDEREEMDE
jgi:hypothetical protein